jgi:hypothetical protein
MQYGLISDVLRYWRMPQSNKIYKNKYKECVKKTASVSLQMVRNITQKEADTVIDKVFDKCLNDTEPFGRRIRTYEDYERAYINRRKFGYS